MARPEVENEMIAESEVLLRRNELSTLVEFLLDCLCGSTGARRG